MPQRLTTYTEKTLKTQYVAITEHDVTDTIDWIDRHGVERHGEGDARDDPAGRGNRRSVLTCVHARMVAAGTDSPPGDFPRPPRRTTQDQGGDDR